jgi:hemerythrin-like metal-binding protein
MSRKVNTQLEKSSSVARKDFQALGDEVNTSFSAMGRKVSSNLLETTEKVLSQEEQNVSKGMEKLLLSKAEGVASVVASVGLDSIMAQDYQKLVDFSRAGAKTEDVLFVLFFGEEDAPLPAYLNLTDKTIFGYLEDVEYDESSEMEEEAQQILQVLEQAENDSAVFVHSRPIEYYGKKMGTVVIGISRKVVISEIGAMSGRFKELKENTKRSISTTLTAESEDVVRNIESSLGAVQQNNDDSLEKTREMLQQSSNDVRASTTNVVLMVGVLSCLAILGIFTVLLKLMVVGPIQQISKGLQDAAEGEGDLTKRLNSQRSDEIGMLAGWFDAFVERLNNIIVEIGNNSETVTSSSLEVLSASEALKSESSDLSLKADTVAAASEEMNASMNSVAAASEQASTNIALVADTATEMKNALESVVEQCQEATETSHSANAQVQTATGKVSQLGEAAREISKVTEVITEIADQTNLLALNATIEAARAGDAGKGFAVVAGEIKGLANQTQEATKEIKEKIESIQGSTQGTVDEVGRINQVIGDVDTIISSISQSMAAQAERASEVAVNIEQASQGIGEVNENVAQSSQVAAEIAQDMGEVSTVSKEMNGRSNTLRTNSESLSELSSQLRNMISVFKVSMPKGSDAGMKKGGQVEELFPWTDALSIGLPEIDKQHKKLVALVNELHAAMKLKKGSVTSGKVLDELVRYTETHFAFEEQLFDKYEYSDRAAHKKQHADLVRQVNDFKSEFKSGRAGLSMDLMHFLTDWLKDHIMKTDKAYAPFLRDKPM